MGSKPSKSSRRSSAMRNAEDTGRNSSMQRRSTSRKSSQRPTGSVRIKGRMISVFSVETIIRGCKTIDKVNQKMTNFCGRGLVARENRSIKSLNHDTRPILSFATSYVSASFTNTQQQNPYRKMILALSFLHPMNENKYYRVANKINK